MAQERDDLVYLPSGVSERFDEMVERAGLILTRRARRGAAPRYLAAPDSTAEIRDSGPRVGCTSGDGLRIAALDCSEESRKERPRRSSSRQPDAWRVMRPP